MNQPFLSVIIPVYNALPYLQTCLNSVVCQKFRDLEIILVDDGSGDGSGEVCLYYTKNHDNIKLIKQENRGVLRARQAAAMEAAGRYIGFVDADDWIDPAMFERLCLTAQNIGADMVVCDYIEHTGDESRTCRFGMETGLYAGVNYENQILVPLFSRPDRSAFSLLSTQWNAIVKSDIAKKEIDLLPADISLGEDTAFIMSCSLSSTSLSYVNEPLYHYRIHGGSAMRRGWHERPEELSNQRELLYLHLKRRLEDRMVSGFLGQLESYMLYLAWLDLNNFFSSMDKICNKMSGQENAARYLAAPWLQELLKLEGQNSLPQRWTEIISELESRI